MGIKRTDPSIGNRNTDQGVKISEYEEMRKTVRRKYDEIQVLSEEQAVSQRESSIWQELARKYDVENASLREIKTLSKQLYHAGEITGFECALLTFDPSESPQLNTAEFYLTPANPNGKRDWLKEYEAKSSRDLRMGLTQNYMHNQRVVAILKKLCR